MSIYSRIDINRLFVKKSLISLSSSAIHLNPLRANQVKTIRKLDNYKWCGHSGLVGKYQVDWQDRDDVLTDQASACRIHKHLDTQ